MPSKRYESTGVDRRTWLHVPSGTPWSTSAQKFEIDFEIEIEFEERLTDNCVQQIEINTKRTLRARV